MLVKEYEMVTTSATLDGLVPVYGLGSADPIAKIPSGVDIRIEFLKPNTALALYDKGSLSKEDIDNNRLLGDTRLAEAQSCSWKTILSDGQVTGFMSFCILDRTPTDLLKGKEFDVLLRGVMDDGRSIIAAIEGVKFLEIMTSISIDAVIITESAIFSGKAARNWKRVPF